jgi:hypothetical protein
MLASTAKLLLLVFPFLIQIPCAIPLSRYYVLVINLHRLFDCTNRDLKAKSAALPFSMAPNAVELVMIIMRALVSPSSRRARLL